MAVSTYDLVSEELKGDASEDTYFLTVAKEGVGMAHPGDILVGEILTRHNGSRLLVISNGPAGSGDFDMPVEELEGDADTDHVFIVASKTDLPELLNRTTGATNIPDGDGWILVTTLPLPS